MWGISWGGFNALQLAALRPPGLEGDHDALLDGRPLRRRRPLPRRVRPRPRHAPLGLFDADVERASAGPAALRRGLAREWLERLEGANNWIEPWLGHQRRDAYWKHGSVCEDYSAIECPVYAVGGWVDGYTNAVPRLLEGLSVPRKGLIGPWAHAFPDDALPGPSIGFLQECVRWWDHWLKGIDTGLMDEPMLRVWMQASVEPRELRGAAGRWVAEPAWPSPRIARRGVGSAAVPLATRRADDRDRGGHLDREGGRRSRRRPACRGRRLAHLGLEPLAEPLEILGSPRSCSRSSADRPALVAVRLCDVAPTARRSSSPAGSSTSRIARATSTRRRSSPAAATRCRAARRDRHSFPAGHHLRVGVSPDLLAVGVALARGGHAERPRRPARPPGAAAAARGRLSCPAFAEPEHPLPLDRGGPRPAHRRQVPPQGACNRPRRAGLRLGARRLRPIPRRRPGDSRTRATCVYSIVEGTRSPPRCASTLSPAWAGASGTDASEVTSSMTSDPGRSRSTRTLKVRENGDEVFTGARGRSISRATTSSLDSSEGLITRRPERLS